MNRFPAIQIDLGGKMRSNYRLDHVPMPNRDIASVLLSLKGTESGVFLYGGEPTLRKDLPLLLNQLTEKGVVDLTLQTDGAALQEEQRLKGLMAKGLTKISFRLTSLRSDANDWLMGFKGATRATIRSMRIARQLGLQIEAEIPLTRPTLHFIDETISGLCRLGVGKIRIRRLRAIGPAEPYFAALSPRLSQIASHLRGAEAIAHQHRTPFELSGFPCSLLPKLKPYLIADDRYDAFSDGPNGDSQGHCYDRPMDYGARFGWHEFPHKSLSTEQTARRLHFHRDESSRRIRKRMVAMTADKVSVLRITGDFRHRSAPNLLKDALRLSIPRLEMSGDLRPLNDFSHSQLIMLKQFHRIDACVYGLTAESHDAFLSQPGSFQQQMTALSKIKGPEKGLVLCLSSTRDLNDAMTAIPKYDPDLTLSFRLIAPGSSLKSLFKMAQTLPSPYDKKVYELLPSCFHPTSATTMRETPSELNWAHAAPHERHELPGDRLSTYTSCPFCQDPNCLGVPVAWRDAALSSRPVL